MAVLVALVETGGLGQGGDVRFGEEAVEGLAALDIFRDEQRVFRVLGKDLLQIR